MVRNLLSSRAICSLLLWLQKTNLKQQLSSKNEYTFTLYANSMSNLTEHHMAWTPIVRELFTLQ